MEKTEQNSRKSEGRADSTPFLKASGRAANALGMINHTRLIETGIREDISSRIPSSRNPEWSIMREVLNGPNRRKGG
jgi:hypothetical protein